MTSAVFNKLYKSLNEAQREAVDTIEGPVMVVAGPGTGKTTILTLRIANILRKTDATPDSVLALTFTESGVFSMRKNLVEIIGSAGYRVHINTFHSFCNDVIKRFPDEFPKIIGANPINEVEKLSLLKDIILASSLKKLKPFGDNFYYLTPLSGKISELKRENSTPKKLAHILKMHESRFKTIPDLYYEHGVHAGEMKGVYRSEYKKIEKNWELLKVYTAYEKALREKRLYDFEDMIIEVIEALEKNKDLLLMLQEEYQYILADEHQDANGSQNRLLELLASFHTNPNLFIVGDEKQAIFRFQGASLENFLYFKKRYPEATLITLEKNYRSTQTILDSAHSMISNRRVQNDFFKKELVGMAGKGTPVLLRVFSKPEHELAFLAEDIRAKIKEGVSSEEIAVLYRNNRDAEGVSRVFEKTDLPFVIESGQHILEDAEIQKFLLILRAVHSFGDESQLLPFLHIDFLNLLPLDIYRLTGYGKKKRLSLYSVIGSDRALKDAGVEKPKSFHALHALLESWKKVSMNKNLLEFLDIVVRESGFLAHILKTPHADDVMRKLRALYDTVEELIENNRTYDLGKFIEYLDMLEAYNVRIEKSSREIVPRSVRCMTAHKSKGLEFDYVYIIGVKDGQWGNKRSIEHFPVPAEDVSGIFDRNDDERRLFYVALTRARLGVSVSYAKRGEGGKEELPSQFVGEITPGLIKTESTEKFEKRFKTETLFLPKREASASFKDTEYLNHLFREQGLSVTALNNYLECPWNYFYSNLLRVPKAPNKHLMFGNAVHRALRLFFDKVRTGESIGQKGLLLLFEDSLKKEPFSESEFSEAFEKGTLALAGYYKTYHRKWVPTIVNEFKVIAHCPLGGQTSEKLLLRGVLDKIEILGSQGEVNVVDYKTGKPKGRKAMEGEGKGSRGNYKRQLTFYKLLLELLEPKRFTFVSGEIDFVEPDERGRYHKEKFFVSDEEVDELKTLLSRVSQEILSLSFWNSRCDEKHCPYCSMREMMG